MKEKRSQKSNQIFWCGDRRTTHFLFQKIKIIAHSPAKAKFLVVKFSSRIFQIFFLEFLKFVVGRFSTFWKEHFNNLKKNIFAKLAFSFGFTRSGRFTLTNCTNAYKMCGNRLSIIVNNFSLFALWLPEPPKQDFSRFGIRICGI